MTWKVPVVLPIAVVAPAPEDKVVVPVEVRLVKVPAAAVVAPIAVVLIPVEVVLKWPDVKFKSAPPEVAIEEAVRPAKVKAPDVEFKVRSPVDKAKPFEAVKSSVEAKDPTATVVTPDLPRLTPMAFVAPMLIWPLAFDPVPASTETFPPVLVPFVPVALPASKVKVPPVDVVKPDWSPALRVKPAPVPVAAPDNPGWKTKAVAVPAPEAVVVMSAVCAPAKVTTPADDTLKLDPVNVRVPVVLPIVVVDPPVEAKVVLPVEVRLVNVPAAAVVAPIAVELIPVDVVVKW
jgi:hypothetical protein